MAPEQVQKGTLNARTDVFGLGATLHRVLTGKPIPTEMNQTINMHSQGLVGKRVAEIRTTATDELPVCVVRLIEACCQTNPEDRLPDMTALMDRIELARTILSVRPAEKRPVIDEEEEDDNDLERTATGLDFLDDGE
jgi:hypothetical protein